MKIIWWFLILWSATDNIFYNFAPFLPFYLTNNLEKKNSENIKTSFYTNEPKIMIICYTILETWCVTDCYFSFWAISYLFIFCYFLLFEVRFLRNRVRQTEFCHFGPFLSPNNPENLNFEKMKKESGDVIILHLRIKNHHNMMYVF